MRIAKKPTIPDVIARFADYVEMPGNEVWGSLHVVLDDGNIQDSHVRSCIDLATERNDTEGANLARVLLTMSKTQRARLDQDVRAFVEVRSISPVLGA